MRPTVFVIGAGASCSFGFPIGRDLVGKIRSELHAAFATPHHGGEIKQALENLGLLNGETPEKARRLRDALIGQQSIDQALNTLQDDPAIVELGKLAIAQQIAKAERECSLAQCDSVNINATFGGLVAYRDKWLIQLLQLIAGDRRPNQMLDAFDDVSFVIFNYDRCVEQTLLYGLSRMFGQTSDQIRHINARLRIIHVYGDLGDLQFAPAGLPGTFGETAPDLGEMYRNIRTFTEGADAGIMGQIHQVMVAAERIVLLGFGCGKQNLEILFPDGIQSTQQLWGTFTVDARTRSAVTEVLNRGRDVHHGHDLSGLHNEYCEAFMDRLGPEIVRT